MILPCWPAGGHWWLGRSDRESLFGGVTRAYDTGIVYIKVYSCNYPRTVIPPLYCLQSQMGFPALQGVPTALKCTINSYCKKSETIIIYYVQPYSFGAARRLLYGCSGVSMVQAACIWHPLLAVWQKELAASSFCCRFGVLVSRANFLSRNNIHTHYQIKSTIIIQDGTN